MTFRGAYSSTVNYGLADGVLFNGSAYVSLVASNHGNAPDVSPSQWSLFATGSPGAQGPAGPPGLQGLPGTPGLQGALHGSRSARASWAAGACGGELYGELCIDNELCAA